MKRFIAVLVVLALAAGGVFAATRGMNSGRRTDGLYYAATNIHPDAELLEINGDAVTAEEYLYWLAYDCEYLTSYSSDLDWDSPVTDDMTYAQYAKTDALETVKLYTIIRQWARDGELTISEEDQAQLDAQRQEYVTYYGGQEGYDRQIQLMGVSQEAFDAINSVYYLYAQVRQQFCAEDGVLHPAAEDLDAFAAEGNYMTAKLLYVSTVALENPDAIEAKETQALDYAAQLQQAEDVDALYAQLAEELHLDGPENGLTFSASDDSLDADLIAAVSALEEGQVSDVITCDNGYYVAIRMPLDREAVAGDYFDARLQDARDSAQIKYNQKLYDSIDPAAFYAQLLQERSDLQQQFDAADADTEAGAEAEAQQDAAPAGSDTAADPAAPEN